MSKNTAGNIRGYDIWCLDNSIQIALAFIVEQLRAECRSEQLRANIHSWAVQSSVNDLHFSIPCDWPEPVYLELLEVIEVAIRRVRSHGDFTADDVDNWFILDDLKVTGGFLRVHRLPAERVIEVLEGFSEMIKGNYPRPAEKSFIELGYLR